jgi:phage baseplate assembly protein W
MTKSAIGLSYPLRMGQDGYFETNSDTISQISSNIKTILLTKIGERRFNNSFGSGIYKFLFEQRDLDISKDMLVNIIQNDIDKFLNGVLINDVNVQLSENQINQTNNTSNSIFINIIFTYRQLQSDVNVEINTINL